MQILGMLHTGKLVQWCCCCHNVCIQHAAAPSVDIFVPRRRLIIGPMGMLGKRNPRPSETNSELSGKLLAIFGGLIDDAVRCCHASAKAGKFIEYQSRLGVPSKFVAVGDRMAGRKGVFIFGAGNSSGLMMWYVGQVICIAVCDHIGGESVSIGLRDGQTARLELVVG